MAIQDYKPNTSPEQLPSDGLIKALLPPDLPHSHFFDKAPSFHRNKPRKISELERSSWQNRVDTLQLAQTHTVVRRGRASDESARAACLDYRAESQTIRPVHNLWETFPTASGKEWDVKLGLIMPRAAPELPKVVNRVRVFKSGEVEVRTVLKGRSTSKPPPRSYGPRWSRGVSGNGRRVIRRSVAALVAAESCQVALYTLSSQSMMADRDFTKAVQSFLAWGRKYLPHVFKHYVIAFELQARGTLHAHLLLFKRIPKGLWRRMRDLWAVKYEMGPGSFDVRVKFRKGSRAANYICKYTTDKESIYRLGLDAEGMLTHEPWRVSRHNGQVYERMSFRGNAYRVSDALRHYALPIAEYHLPWGSPLALRLSCNLKGGVRFFGSSGEALDWVTSNLPSGP